MEFGGLTSVRMPKICHHYIASSCFTRLSKTVCGQVVSSSLGEPLACFSKGSVRKVLSRYSYENELMALVLIVQHWRPYSGIPFFSDRRPLWSLQNLQTIEYACPLAPHAQNIARI
ncbi:hypothetical protein V2J09_004541 [Rumex salicifolius]